MCLLKGWMDGCLTSKISGIHEVKIVKSKHGIIKTFPML